MSKIIGLALRGLEFTFTIIIMGMIGNIIAMAWAGNPSSINYSMFTVAFSLVSLFYLIPATWSESIAGHPMIVVVFDLLNMIFFLCAGIALAARLHVHSCKNRVRFHVTGPVAFENANSCFYNRTTWIATRLPTARHQTTERLAAEKRRHRAPSCGLRGLVTLVLFACR
jgi:hypothetical protein